MNRVLSILLVSLLLVSTIGMPVFGAGVASAESDEDETQTVEDVLDELDRSAALELVQTEVGDITEAEYRAVVIWFDSNPTNFSTDESDRYSEWTDSLSESFDVTPSEIVEEYEAEQETEQSEPEEEESGSDSTNGESDESESNTEDGMVISDSDQIEADRVFLNGVRLNELEHQEELAKFELQNPTDSVARVIVNPGGTDEQLFVRLRPGETEEIHVEVSPSGFTQEWSVTVSSEIGTDEFDEVVEDGGTTSQAQYTIQQEWRVINHNPDVGHEIVITILGGVTVFLTTFAVFSWDSRVSRMAIPVNAPARGIFDDRKDFRPDQGTLERALGFASGWVKGWGLIVVSLSVFVLGVLHFVDASPIESARIAGSTVYLMYGQVFFLIPGGALGFWIARKMFVEIHDINPANGDNWLWLLSPQRFANMKVMREVEDRDTGERLVFEVDKDWLYSINSESPRDAYEVEKYDPINNVAWVSWSGEAEKIEPHELRRHQRLVPWIQDIASYVIDQNSQLKNYYAEDVRYEAELLNAGQTALIEDELHEGMGSTRERLKGRMRDRGHGDLIEGNEAAVVDEVAETIDESDPRENQKQRANERMGKRVDAGDSDE